jgi:NADPH-dependent 2,4-dienoyl-CoA reductase/sulfur reductase-like enzyme
MGAVAASTLGLTARKIARPFSALSARSSAPAVNAFAASGNASAKSYRHLLSPLKIRNRILKNRIMHTIGIPHFLQGPETWPSEVYRDYYARFARNGAAVVIVPAVVVKGDPGTPVSREGLLTDSAHMEMFDTTNPACQNYLDQIVESVHAYGSLVCAGGRSFGTVENREVLGGMSRKEMIDHAVTQAKLLEDKGVDMVYMAVDYSDRDRSREVIEQIEAVKNATRLVIAVRLNVRGVLPRPETSDNHVLTEASMEDAVTIANWYEGAVDILQFRLGAAMGSHPTGYNQKEGSPDSLIIAKAIRDSGSKMLLAPNGGFQDLDENDGFIANGQCDLITMIRAFHADFDYAQKAYEGRGEDVAPCILCNKCHGLSMEGPWTSVCSVNPKLGIEPAVRVITAPAVSRKIAVIGGGPAGMKAAVTAAERGHRVTLYEKNGALGGLLRHADFDDYKWPLKGFKDYLIRQVAKSGIEVHLNTAATPEMIRSGGFDTVFAALGAAPSIPRIAGGDGSNVWGVLEAYENEKKLGKRVVVVGGGKYGVETGIFLAGTGHRTTVLSSARELLPIDRVHYPEIVIDTYEHLENFDFVLEAIPTRISGKKVFYNDTDGKERSLPADDVVLYAGLSPRQDEALQFLESAGNAFFTTGDCTGECGNVQKTIRNAFFTASQI